MNVQLENVTVTSREGKVSHLEQVYIRGSHVRFFKVPELLRYGFVNIHILIVANDNFRHAPMFKPQILARASATTSRGRGGGARGGRGSSRGGRF